MRKKSLLSIVLGLALMMGAFFTSCSEDDGPAKPTVELFITTDGFTIDIAAEAENATTWAWEYGDGAVSETAGSHTYTYATGGDFTVKCTVTGDGGPTTVTEIVNIATIEELLTAHTWVMSNAGTGNGLGFHITPDLAIDFPATDVLATINGLQDDTDVPYDFTDKYEDEYNFNADKSYAVDYKNDNVLSSWVYSPQDKIVGTCFYVGMFAISQDPLQGATWALHENQNLVLNTVFDEDQDNGGGVAETINFESIDYVTFTNGGFLGIKDYTSTVLIRSITVDELAVTVFFHGYYDGTLGVAEPSYLLNLTFKAK